MIRKTLVGAAAVALVATSLVASNAEAQFVLFPALDDPTKPTVTFFEQTSRGTPSFAVIDRTGGTFSSISPATRPAIGANAIRLANGLINAGFPPTSPARWFNF
jgi:hypothetical protein